MLKKSYSLEPWILPSILLVGLFVRIWGIHFGLPHTECRPDETAIVSRALGFFSGDFNPRFVDPTFYLYMLFGVYLVYYIVGQVVGVYGSTDDLLRQFVAYPSYFYLLDRYLSLGFGIASIAVVYSIVQRFYNRPAAAIAALFLSLSPLHVRDSHFGVTDVAQTCLILVAVALMLRSYRQARWQPYLYAGMCSGLALSTQYTALPLVITMGVTHALKRWQTPPSEKAHMPKLSIFGSAFLGAFFIGTPFALLEPQHFLAAVATRLEPVMQANHLIQGLWHHVGFTLPLGLGWGILVAAVLGGIAAFQRHRHEAAILFSFPIAYSLLISQSPAANLRQMVAVVPFACMAAAIFLCMLGEWLVQQKLQRSLPGWVMLLLMTLILVQPVYSILQSDRLLATLDNRVVTAAWMRQHIPQGSSVYQTGLLYGQVVLERSPRWVAEQLQSPQVNGQKSFAAWIEPMQAGYTEQYQQWDYDPTVGIFYFAKKLQTQLPDYIVVQENAVEEKILLDRQLAELIQDSYALKRSFKAMEIRDPQHRFDRQDAFYLPFAGFRNVQRPGTNLYVYQRLNQA